MWQTLLDAVGGQVITIRASYSFIQMLILAGPECIWTDHHFMLLVAVSALKVSAVDGLFIMLLLTTTPADMLLMVTCSLLFRV